MVINYNRFLLKKQECIEILERVVEGREESKNEKRVNLFSIFEEV